MTRPLLSATLICRDEAHNVKRCLDSIAANVDEIVVVDTGSTDGTIAELKKYAAKHKFPKGKLKVGHFDWIDDFAAARQAADDLATGQWVVWLDFDDEIRGAEHLRGMAAAAGDEVVAFFARYSYARDASGNTISELWRERLVRHNGTRWTGRLHEHKLFNQGTVVKVAPSLAEWVHHRDHENRTGDRNIRVLTKWAQDEPDSARIISSLAMEYMGAERHKEASDTFAHFLTLPGEPPDRRAQATRHMCVMLMVQGRVQEAKLAALQSLAEMPTWADTYLTLAECEQTLGRPDAGLVHARTAIEIGQPDTLLIINPLQYTVHPRALMAVCLAQMGRFDESVKTAEEALALAPAYGLLTQHLPLWRAQLKKQHALGAFVGCADVLVETGELLKARALLEQAPFFIAEDPRLIGKRSELARLIDERRSAAPAEDTAADAFVKRHLEMAA